ncbi:hypothetical protein RDI58_024184 [Solanum bulbocastanum]|uniref:Uncharacterized protein n=1 Tax=Solanum bulbocastanum TaxID=147425 RepID=A0AAN8T2I9_SOLBU
MVNFKQVLLFHGNLIVFVALNTTPIVSPRSLIGSKDEIGM